MHFACLNVAQAYRFDRTNKMLLDKSTLGNTKKEKSLYLANCLNGVARYLLNELDSDGRRDYDTLIEKLKNRFGSVNQSEIYRTQLKSTTRNKGETIQELAQAIKKLVRQAHPGVNKDVIETLSLDNFIDAITDSDIRMRVQELIPKSLDEAGQICVCLEAYKIADKQKTCFVGRLGTKIESSKDRQFISSSQFVILSDALSFLTNEVKYFSQKNTKNSNTGSSDNQRFQRNKGRSMNQRYNNRHQRYINDIQRGNNRHQSYISGNQRCNNRHQRFINGKQGYNHRNPTFNNGNQRYTNSRQRLDRSYINNCTHYAVNSEQNFAYRYKGTNSADSYNSKQFPLNRENLKNQGLNNQLNVCTTLVTEGGVARVK